MKCLKMNKNSLNVGIQYKDREDGPIDETTAITRNLENWIYFPVVASYAVNCYMIDISTFPTKAFLQELCD
jgi:hypothetical protein